MVGVLFRLFKCAWYLIWLPVHVVLYFISLTVVVFLMVIDLPLWVLLGKYGVLSDSALTWNTYHLDKMFGE